ncbi:coiled-coil domain-containing protein 159 [Discoglossus pictus]
MNWDTQLSSILNATESNMAKIKERLYVRGDLSKDNLNYDFLPSRAPLYDDVPAKPALPYSSSANSYNCAGSSEDPVTLSSQLLSQAKMITTLHQAIGKLERDRDQQQQRLQGLEDEVRRLRGLQGDTGDSLTERKIEDLRQELSKELRYLQERVRDPPMREPSPGQRSTASIVQEVNENKRLLWKEYENLRRDTDYLHQRLRRQEDDMLRQLSEAQEVKRAQDRNAKMLEGLLSSQQTQTMELNRTRTETQEVQRDLLQIRSAIGDLKEDMRILEGKVYAQPVRSDRTERAKPALRKKKTVQSSSPSSEEDYVSHISLADISSEDTSYSFNLPTTSHGSKERSIPSHGRSSRDQKTRSSLQLDDFNDDLGGLSDTPSELSFSDL